MPPITMLYVSNVKWLIRPYSNFVSIIHGCNLVFREVICSIPSHKDILYYSMTLPTHHAFITFMYHSLSFTWYKSFRT